MSTSHLQWWVVLLWCGGKGNLYPSSKENLCPTFRQIRREGWILPVSVDSQLPSTQKNLGEGNAPPPVLLPGKSHGQRSLVGCSPWGRYESDTTERLHFRFSLSCIGEGNGNPLQCSCLENPRDEGAWWAAVYGVAQSRTWLKRLSSSSSKRTFMPTQYIWGSIFWSPSVSTYLILKKMTLPIVLLCPYFTLWRNSFSQCTRMCFFLCSA